MVELPRSGYRRRQNTKKAVISNRLDFGRYKAIICSNHPNHQELIRPKKINYLQ